MSPMEYAPEARDDKPAGTPQAETVTPNIADMWCLCAIEARIGGEAEPVWSFDDGYWKCSRPDLPDHDVTDAPPTTTGLIPCQPVFPWNPADHPELAERALAQLELERELTERGPLGGLL